MNSRFELKKYSGTLGNILALFDCFIAVSFIPLLSLIYTVPWSQYYSFLLILVFLLCLVIFPSSDMYRPWQGIRFYRELVAILKAWGVVLGLIFLTFFITKTSLTFSRRILLTYSVLTPMAIFINHVALRYILRIAQKKGYNIKKAIVVGAGELGMAFYKQYKLVSWAGIRIIGFFDDNRKVPLSKECDVPVMGSIDALPDFIRRSDVNVVYIALPFREEKTIFMILNFARTLGVEVKLVPDMMAFNLLNAEFTTMGDMLLVDFNPKLKAKRVFDLIFALITLILLSPFFGLIALVVKIQDWGPVFYRHKRVTVTGKTFNCLKFRTMNVDAEKQFEEMLVNDPEIKQEWNQSYKIKNDPRITRFGLFLRKTSLDELPQFINVLKGEMSVVGARPIVSKEMRDNYYHCAGLYCSIKPGITGPWQIGKRSDTADYQERVQLDTEYILNQSLVRDLLIIAKTVVKMINGKGAY